MRSRQRGPERWLIIDRGLTPELKKSVGRLPFGSGVLVIAQLRSIERAWLNAAARRCSLCLVQERRGAAARVHSQRELTRAQLSRTPVILISPIYATSSHPEWKPLPRLRAATLARLTGRRAIALGGMNRDRYARIAPLGFVGWAGISAFRT